MSRHTIGTIHLGNQTIPEREYLERAMANQPTQIEKENLEMHVELCALRYQQLELRLTNIETKVESLAGKISESSNSMSKVIIGATATIVAGLISTVITILMKF